MEPNNLIQERSEKYSIEQWQANYGNDVESGKPYRQMVKEAK
jgi:hypothetical protein